MMDKLTAEEKVKVEAMTHDEKMEYMVTKFGVDYMLENCKMMKSLTEEEKTKLKAMTKEELLTYMKDKR
jgi:predicted transcriptional regulator